MRQPAVPVIDRILRRTVYEHGCWIFQGAKTNGYGVVGIDSHRHTGLVHRIVYSELGGHIPAGMFLDHLCRNRGCCNPLHLEVVTLAENNRRGPTRRASRGRPWTPARRAAQKKRRYNAGD